MENRKSASMRIDWKWVGVGYCIFVVFHLLPSLFLLEFVRQGLGGNLLRSLWGLMGLVVVGLYIGYRSRGYTILEPAIAALLYAVTIFLKSGELIGGKWTSQSAGMLLVMSVGAFLLAMFGAWIGEMLQTRKEQAERQTSS